MLPRRALHLGSAQPGHPFTVAPIDDGEAIGVLELGTGSRKGLPVLPDFHPAAIESDERGGDMDVLIALCTHPVPDRDPGGGRQGLSFETQRHHETGGDLSPLLVDEGSIPGG